MSEGAHAAAQRVRDLPIWSGNVEPEALSGGITNLNYRVRDASGAYFVRVGDDIPIHLIQRRQEHAATRAAHAAGLAPEVVHTGDGILVLRFVEGRTLDEADVRDPRTLRRLVPALRRCHHEIPKHLRGPALMFWVFHAIRHYAGELQDRASPYTDRLPELLDKARELENAIGRIEVVFGHNDLLPANFIDDGERIWLIDYDYAGFNSPLFDLGGLASNAEMPAELEDDLLTQYYGEQPDTQLKRRFNAMKCASLLRESMWSMTSELISELDFDFAAYTQENLDRLERAWDVYART
ncbi:Thiamine kinase [Limimonas halophila]|uniref:Thiamine kinase n=1 Tax=Limimonas halophila TaxID=1082479 RepID=A0A1G7LJH5_9PROT|nr:phosphotransferase [Limimonas halophila]SDF49635.1 Thiamine kinase [Limimonas halophila]